MRRLLTCAVAALVLAGLGGCLGGAGPGADTFGEITESVLPPLADAAGEAVQNSGADTDGPGADNGRVAEGATADAGAQDIPPESAPDTAAEPVTDPAPEASAPPEAAPTPPNPALAGVQRACAAQGGRLVPVGTGSARMICLNQTRDSGKRCSARGDCEGECLARSNTCAPVRPLFGCHEVLNARGARVTECLE